MFLNVSLWFSIFLFQMYISKRNYMNKIGNILLAMGKAFVIAPICFIKIN